MKKLIATQRHISKYPNPIKFQKGDNLSFGKKDTEFEGWIWVIDNDKNEGWAPTQFLYFLSDDEGIAIQDYCAIELDVNPGDELELIYVLNEWGWVKAIDGSTFITSSL